MAATLYVLGAPLDRGPTRPTAGLTPLLNGRIVSQLFFYEAFISAHPRTTHTFVSALWLRRALDHASVLCTRSEERIAGVFASHGASGRPWQGPKSRWPPKPPWARLVGLARPDTAPHYFFLFTIVCC